MIKRYSLFGSELKFKSRYHRGKFNRSITMELFMEKVQGKYILHKDPANKQQWSLKEKITVERAHIQNQENTAGHIMRNWDLENWTLTGKKNSGGG